MTKTSSRGKMLWETFREHLQAFQCGPVANSRARSVIIGVSSRGSFVGGMTLDSFLTHAGKVLLDSGLVYRWQNSICFEVRNAGDPQLIVLAAGQKAESHAGSHLANLMCVGVQGGDGVSQSLLPSNLIGALLADQELWRQLPMIRSYSRRPLFDESFKLCAPGWNSENGILVHGPDLTPVMEVVTCPADAPAIDHLPPYLKRLFADFCWESDADLTNAVALLLTGFLVNHFVVDPKPIGIIAGNQKGLGKTLLIQAFGHLLDGEEPPRIPLVRDEELEKKLCSQLREARSSIFFFDNVRERVDSPLIEAGALSPVLSYRILGQSGNISRPNAFLWVITSNQASGTEDFISRGLPIRLHYEGDPRQRKFNENLLDFVRKERLQILGELAGLVLRWKQDGMARGIVPHRCTRWSEVIGGILHSAGLDNFLSNVAETEATMDEGLVALSALAEHVVTKGLTSFYVTASNHPSDTGKTAADWAQLFNAAGLFGDQLNAKTPKGRETWVGTFLGAKGGRSVSFTTPEGSWTAVLTVRKERSRRKLYLFEMTLDPEPTEDSRTEVPLPAAPLLASRSRMASETALVPVDPAPLPMLQVPATTDLMAGEDLEWL